MLLDDTKKPLNASALSGCNGTSLQDYGRTWPAIVQVGLAFPAPIAYVPPDGQVGTDFM